jgi:hypothetical protein
VFFADDDRDRDGTESTRLAGDLKESFHGEAAGLRAGLVRTDVALGSGMRGLFSSDSLRECCSSGLTLAGGFTGLFLKGLKGVFSRPASSSSEPASLDRGRFWPSFLGLRGVLSFLTSVDDAADLVAALVVLPLEAGLRTGLARIPTAESAALLLVFLVATVGAETGVACSD